MKKIILFLSCFLLSSVAFTKNRTYLMVDLANYGSEDCKLISGELKKGALYQSRFPDTLAATGNIYYFTLTGSDTEARLMYQCGEYKKFMISMRQYRKSGHEHSVIVAEMPFSKDVTEKHQSTAATKHKNREGTLSWQFYH